MLILFLVSVRRTQRADYNYDYGRGRDACAPGKARCSQLACAGVSGCHLTGGKHSGACKSANHR